MRIHVDPDTDPQHVNIGNTVPYPLSGRHTYERQVGLLLIVNRVQDLLPYRAETEKSLVIILYFLPT
jgi:hypothetical protein